MEFRMSLLALAILGTLFSLAYVEKRVSAIETQLENAVMVVEDGE